MAWLERITDELAVWRVKNFWTRFKRKGWNRRQALDAWQHVDRHVRGWVSPERAVELLADPPYAGGRHGWCCKNVTLENQQVINKTPQSRGVSQ